MAAPKYNVDDVVYLAESAKIGALESYQITAQYRDGSGVWVYRIGVPDRLPNSPTVGDRNNLKRTFDFNMTEDEFCSFCEALALAESYLQRELARIQSLKTTYCNGGTSS
jgi:hypothetical protein